MRTMKKIFLAILLSFFFITNVFSQSVKNINLKEYELSDKNEEVFLAECETHGENYFDGVNIVYGKSVEVYILGWSKDGKLAVLENREVDGRGGYDLYFTIFDTVEDEKVYFHNFEFYDENENCTVAQCVQNNYKQIDDVLKKYGIIFQKTASQSLPAKINGDEFTFNVKVIKNEPSEYGIGFTLSYDIEAIKNNKSKKTITEVRDKFCNKVVVTGYLKNPYENRIAVIVLSSKYVFEGSELELAFYGCNLAKGFK